MASRRPFAILGGRWVIEMSEREGDEGVDRRLDVIYVPTPEKVVAKMLQVARIQEGDVLYDLGCGDGRIVIMAAQKYGIRAYGFDGDPARIAVSRENARIAGVDDLVRFEEKNIFDVDLSPATVVAVYLTPEVNAALIPAFKKLAPGSRIVSHDFDMEGARPERSWTVVAEDHQVPDDRIHFVYLWKTPLDLDPYY